MNANEFARIIRKLIIESGMTAKEIEEKSGLSQNTWRKWLRGIKGPRLQTAGMLLKAFGYKIEVVKIQIGGDANESKA